MYKHNALAITCGKIDVIADELKRKFSIAQVQYKTMMRSGGEQQNSVDFAAVTIRYDENRAFRFLPLPFLHLRLQRWASGCSSVDSRSHNTANHTIGWRKGKPRYCTEPSKAFHLQQLRLQSKLYIARKRKWRLLQSPTRVCLPQMNVRSGAVWGKIWRF